MGKTLGLVKSGPRREVVRLLRWSGTEVIMYSKSNSPAARFYRNVNITEKCDRKGHLLTMTYKHKNQKAS